MFTYKEYKGYEWVIDRLAGKLNQLLSNNEMEELIMNLTYEGSEIEHEILFKSISVIRENII